MQISVQEWVEASGKEPAREQVQAPLLEREQAWRRWARALASARRYPPVAQRAGSRLQLPEVSKVPLDGNTQRRAG